MQRYTEITASTAPVIKVSINRIRAILFQWGEEPMQLTGRPSQAALPWLSIGMRLNSALRLGQRRSVYASGVTGITDTRGSCTACTPLVPPARDTPCHCWRVSAGYIGCDDAVRPESTAPDTGPRTTTSTPRSPAAFLKHMQESWGSLVWKQSVRRLGFCGCLCMVR